MTDHNTIIVAANPASETVPPTPGVVLVQEAPQQQNERVPLELLRRVPVGRADGRHQHVWLLVLKDSDSEAQPHICVSLTSNADGMMPHQRNRRPSTLDFSAYITDIDFMALQAALAEAADEERRLRERFASKNHLDAAPLTSKLKIGKRLANEVAKQRVREAAESREAAKTADALAQAEAEDVASQAVAATTAASLRVIPAPPSQGFTKLERKLLDLLSVADRELDKLIALANAHLAR
jgi:hypothetical protein